MNTALGSHPGAMGLFTAQLATIVLLSVFCDYRENISKFFISYMTGEPGDHYWLGRLKEAVVIKRNTQFMNVLWGCMAIMGLG